MEGLQGLESDHKNGERCRFKRKREEWWLCDRQEGQMAREDRAGKTLGFEQNVFSFSLGQPFQQMHKSHTFLGEEESTPKKQMQIQNISSKSSNGKYQPIRLEYSPDSLFSTLEKQVEEDQSEMLLDDCQNMLASKQTKASQAKTAMSRLTAMREELDACDMVPICTSFRVDQKVSLKVELVSLNSYLLRIFYEPLGAEQRNQFRGDSLVLRMKRRVQDNPFVLLQFYCQVLMQYSSSVLRGFLISKVVRFSSQQIQEFQSKMESALENMSSEELIELMFFTKDSEECMILDLEEEYHLESIDLTSRCLWRSLALFFKANSYFTDGRRSMSPLKLFLGSLL